MTVIFEFFQLIQPLRSDIQIGWIQVIPGRANIFQRVDKINDIGGIVCQVLLPMGKICDLNLRDVGKVGIIIESGSIILDAIVNPVAPVNIVIGSSRFSAKASDRGCQGVWLGKGWPKDGNLGYTICIVLSGTSNNLVTIEIMIAGLCRRQPVNRISRDSLSKGIYNHKSRTGPGIGVSANGGVNKNVPFGSGATDNGPPSWIIDIEGQKFAWWIRFKKLEVCQRKSGRKFVRLKLSNFFRTNFPSDMDWARYISPILFAYHRKIQQGFIASLAHVFSIVPGLHPDNKFFQGIPWINQTGTWFVDRRCGYRDHNLAEAVGYGPI